MDRVTRQSPRQRGYGSTSSLRNDSLKHTRKHERRKEGIEPRSKAHRLWRTVRQGGADCPHGTRGPSANVLRTVRTGTADRPAWAVDCPLKPTEPPVANPEKRTVRGEHANCPPGTRGPSARCCGLSETTSNQNGSKAKSSKNTKNTGRTRSSRIVRASRTDLKTARPRRSTPPNHHRISQTVEAVETRV
jgi:hypothetical protein